LLSIGISEAIDMKNSSWRALAFASLLTAGSATAAGYLDTVVNGSAQAGGTGNWSSFASVTPTYQGNADLDGRGNFSMGGVIARGGVSYDLGGANRVGLTLDYNYLDYSFSSPSSFGLRPPWGIIQRYGVTLPLSFEAGDGWSVGVAPSVTWFKENGADSGDSISWGATVTGTKRFEDGNRLGLGVGAYDGIEKTTLFPFIVVNWRLGDRWRVINPLPSGPTGPAGLELDYEFDGGWTAGVGAAWRVLRFRLSDTGPTPNGIGQERGVPIFLRVTRNFTEQMALHLYGGVVVAGELRLENSTGGLLREEDFDPAPLFGATFVGRF
jgi:hypothetical protein